MDLQNFEVNIYVIQLIFGAVDIPAKLMSILTITYVGRRFTQAITLILAGLAILANVLVPRGEAGGGGSGVPSSPTYLGGPGRAQPVDGTPRLGNFSFLWGICLNPGVWGLLLSSELSPGRDTEVTPRCPAVPSELRTVRTALAVFGKGCLAASFNCVFLYTGELYPTVIR